MLSHSTSHVPVLSCLQFAMFRGLMLDRGFSGRGIFNLTLCSTTSFNAIFTAHFSIPADLLRGYFLVLL